MKTLVKKRLFWLAVVTPASLAFSFVVRFGVDVPFWDEWGSTGSYLATQLQQPLTSGDYFIQHNESRMPVGRFAFVKSAGIWGWHPKAFMFVTWGLACLSCGLFMRLFVKGSAVGLLDVAFAGLAGMLFFSPVQYENFLWGFQSALFIPGICLMANLLVLRSAWTYPRKVLVCAAVNFFATYSFANGLLCWGLCLPLVPVVLFEWPAASGRDKRKILLWTAVYILLGFVNLVLYFHAYQPPAHHPAFSYVVQHPTVALSYFLAWIGGPHIWMYEATATRVLAARFIGTVFLLASLIWMVLFVRQWLRNRRSKWLKAAYPAICLILYGLASDGMATVGRAGFGVDQALSSRYASFSLTVVLGLVAFLYVVAKQQTDTGQRYGYVQAGVFFLGMVMALGLMNGYSGYNIMKSVSAQQKQNQLTIGLLSVVPANPLLARLYPDPVFVANTAAKLAKAGILPISPIGDWVPVQARRPENGALGAYSLAVQDTVLQAEGWAVLPGAARPADFVLVCRTDTSGSVTDVVSGLTLSGRNGEAVVKYKDKRLEYSRFSEVLKMTTDSVSRNRYTVLAVDTVRRKVYRLARAKN